MAQAGSTRYFTSEQEAFRRSVRNFTADRVKPNFDDWEQQGEIPRWVHKESGDLGILGLGFPEEMGGTGGNFFDVMIAVEELIQGGGSSGLISSLMGHMITVPHFVSFGTPEQQEKWLTPVIQGDMICGMGITEPGGGSDVAGLRTTAKRDGDDFVINGAKIFITNAIRADYLIIAARTGGPGHGGVSLIVVETDREGFSISKKLHKMGWLCSDTAELALQDVRVPVSNLVGELDRGFYQIVKHFQFERLFMAVMAYATAQRCLDLAVEWAKERVTFGKSLSERQVVRHKLAEMATKVECAREFTRSVAYDFVNTGDEGIDARVAMAKNVAIAACDEVVDEAVQIFGGMGFMRESEVERHYRDQRVLAIGGGATEIMRDLIANRMLGKAAS